MVLSAPYLVYVVEDHPIFYEGVEGIIEGEVGFELCGHAPDARTAKSEVPDADPDIVLVDLGLPDGSGLDLIQHLKAIKPELKILVLTGLDESLYAARALRAGAGGFLAKMEASTNLIDAMRSVLSDSVYLHPDLRQKMLSAHLGHDVIPPEPREGLTDRELDVYRLIGAGMTVREIADHLHLSPKTIESYSASIKEKLGLANSRALIRDATLWWYEQSRSEEVEGKAA